MHVGGFGPGVGQADGYLRATGEREVGERVHSAIGLLTAVCPAGLSGQGVVRRDSGLPVGT
jgi:hypothetical protein